MKIDSSERYATDDDLALLEAMERRLQKSPWMKEAFQEEMAKPYSRVLLLTDDETDSKILAYCVYWVLLKDCQILNLLVDTPYRKEGYAERLVRKVLGEAIQQDCERVTLDVRVSNRPAIALYQKIGFTPGVVRSRFYSDGEDGLQMNLLLSQANRRKLESELEDSPSSNISH